MDVVIEIIVLIASIVWILLILFAPNDEKEKFNNGICKVCGQKLKCFDTDSQGGRGYTCSEWHYPVWVSYPSVDKNFKEN